jgi:hypothetical protein
VDFKRLFFLTLSSAFFVVRAKTNVLLQRRYSHQIDKSTGVRSARAVILTSFESASVSRIVPPPTWTWRRKNGSSFLHFTLPAHENLQVEMGRGVVFQMD